MRIQDIVMKLLMDQPFYGYVASSVAFIENSSIETIRMVSIPDQVIYYNPAWFEGLSNRNQMGAVMHELLHVILLHQYRRNNRELILWSVACDMAVSELLPTNYIAEDAVTVERIKDKLKNPVEKGKNAEYYYDFLKDTEDFVSFVAIEGDNILISEGGNLLKVQQISKETASASEISSLKSNLAQTFSEVKTEDGLPQGLSDGVTEIIQDLKIDWRVILKRFLTGRGKMITLKSYKRVSRRYEDLPGTKRSVGVNALIAIDESGSISDELVKYFYQELIEINKITGTSMYVTRFDTICTDPVPLSTFVADYKRTKRGGTDFRPVFQMADAMKIPLVILFTDGDGEAPITVNQKTLWVLTKNGKNPTNFGYSINFEGVIR